VKLLLDTHIWVWLASDPDRLHRRVLAAIEDSEAELWLSPFSIWEFLLLAAGGKLTIQEDRFAWVARALAALPMREAPITTEVAVESERIVLPHRDPADRFIAATARVFDLTLVTSDRRLLRAPGLNVLSNR
jgi:PIN domain nuclease of toxin-antitoxin system